MKCLPEKSCWNGDMVVFAHGYVAPNQPIGVPTDQLTIDGVSLPATFNQFGYGFAASSYSKNGLAILQGISDTQDLVQNVIRPTDNPRRVYLIGASEGGLVTTLSAEQLPQVYNAAGAACGPIGSFQNQINYLGDFRVVFDYFFPNLIPGSAVSIPQEVMTNWDSKYVPRITAALAANPAATAQLLKVTGAPVTTDPATTPQTVLGILWYSVFATNDATLTLGGQPFDNRNRLYFGSANDILLNIFVERFSAAPAALSAVAAHYETTGKLMMPIITMHTTGDPIIPYWHEQAYTLKTLFAGTLLDRTDIPVAAYGHCAFNSAEVFLSFALLVLRDFGQDISSSISEALPEAQRSAFRSKAQYKGLRP
jgi:pimeloyl-ACP methyl ester carboxylesterase